MSSLQVWLAILGGCVLAAVVAHGAWTSRRNAPRQAAQEPGTGEGSGSEPAGAAQADASRQAGLGEISALPAMEKKPGLDALIDVIAPITLETPVSGEAAQAALPPTRRAGSKPFAIEGFNDATQAWEQPAPGMRYTAFQAGVQLASRTGALNEIEYSEFVMKAQAFADAVSGEPEFPEMLEEVSRARELDQFANAHDAQLSFTLRASSAAWSPGYVQQHAARLGFVPGVIPGRLELPASEQGMPPVLGLSFDTQAAMADDPAQSALREVILSLDVAQVARSERPYVRMREAVGALAQAMDGVVTDANGQPITSGAMDGIGSELEQLYDTLDARDLSAGTPLARRLFS